MVGGPRDDNGRLADFKMGLRVAVGLPQPAYGGVECAAQIAAGGVDEPGVQAGN